MKAWRVCELGEPAKVMSLDEISIPQPDVGQLLVRVLGAAASFPDVLMCRGRYQMKAPLPFTPGFELCGQIAALGPETAAFSVGDRVIGSSVLPSGGFAEYALMDIATTFQAPRSLDDAEASAFHIGYQTGWFGLHRRAHLQPGETLLVHAAAGGVGSAAVQLGHAAGACVIGVVGGPEKADVARKLGADVVVDRHTEDFVQIVLEVTNGGGADVVYDPVGGEAFERSTRCIAFEGRILVVGFAGGQIQSAALNHALVKNYSVVGLHWGLYAANEPAMVRTCHEELSRLADSAVVKPLIRDRLPLDACADGLQGLADGNAFGRVTYVPDPRTLRDPTPLTAATGPRCPPWG